MMPHTLELKKDKATDYVLSWKWNGLYASKFEAYSAFLHSIKLSEFKMGIKFDKNLLPSEQKNYLKMFTLAKN